MNYRVLLRTQLTLDEGSRARPYRDTVGKLTIGVGRNLDDNGLRPEEIQFLLENDIDDAERDCIALFHNWEALTPARKAVLANMAFNLGRARLAGFTRLHSAVISGQWQQAAKEMLDSHWAQQVGPRAQRLAQQMRAG
jgi:lysozyme